MRGLTLEARHKVIRSAAILLAITTCIAALMLRVQLPGPASRTSGTGPRSDTAAIAAQPPAERGPYGAGWRRVTVERAAGGTFGALLTYPASVGGPEGSYEGAGAPYPAVAFGHGFLQTPQRYDGTLEHLATWGYFVIAPESHSGLAPDHQSFADDLRESLAWMSARNADAESWLFGQVDTAHYGLSGHSMGAGASLLAAAADDSVRAVANLAAAETSPSSLPAMAHIAAPIALIVGSEDRIVPPSTTGAMYAAARPPKQLVSIVGGYHCGFEDTPFPVGCDRGTLAREEQLAITRQRLTDFFGLYLKGEETLFDAVWDPPTDARITLTAEQGGASASTRAFLSYVANDSPH